MSGRIGQKIGNYQLTQLLGRGGFAEVYLGEHVHLKKRAAIKILHTQLSSQDFQHFRQEAQTITNLRHPNIIRILDFGINPDDNSPYLIMDYAPKGTLRQIYPHGSTLSLATVITYVKDIASALQYTHNAKLVHRDIKPENMLIGSQDEIILSDFGIAVVAHSTSSLQTQDTFGTVHYMAPEHLNGKPRPASDQYALAVVVYEWLTGVRPFRGSSHIEIAMQQITALPRLLREHVPTIAPEVERIVLKALAKDPDQRFEHIQDFAHTLEACGAKSGTLHLTYQGHSDEVRSLSWSPNGEHIGSSGDNGTVQIWEAITGHLVRTKYWSGRRLGSSRLETVSAVAWSPNGKLIAAGSQGSGVEVYDAFTGEKISHYNQHWSVYGGNIINCLAWSPDSRYIASEVNDGWKYEGSLRLHGIRFLAVWEVATGKSVYMCECSHEIGAIAWSPDGKYIAISGGWASNGYQVNIWEVSAEQKIFTYKGQPEGLVMAIAWSPDGKYIASGSSDPAVDRKAVQVWEVATGQTIFTYPNHAESVLAIVWSPDGKYIASGGGKRERLIYKKDNMREDNMIHVWEVATGRTLLKYDGHSGRINTIAWFPNGTRIASASKDKTIQIWQGLNLS